MQDLANELTKVVKKVMAISLRPRDVLLWLRRNLLQHPNLDENDENAIHREMIEQGVARDTHSDFSTVAGALSAIREEMAWTGEDFRSCVKRLA